MLVQPTGYRQEGIKFDMKVTPVMRVVSRFPANRNRDILYKKKVVLEPMKVVDRDRPEDLDENGLNIIV